MSTGTPPDWACGGRRSPAPVRSAAGDQHGRVPPTRTRGRGHRHGRAPIRHPARRPERGRGPRLRRTWPARSRQCRHRARPRRSSGNRPGGRRVPPDPAGAGRGGCGARRIDRTQRDGGSPRGCLGPRRRASRGHAARRRVVGRTVHDRGGNPRPPAGRPPTGRSGGRLQLAPYAQPAGGGCGSTGLADEVGWSRKRLWSRFRSQLGITPKRAARLVRFDHAAHLLAAGHAASRVATESGYVDQSHLHREVKAFTGLTPAAVAVAPWLAIDDVAWPDSVNH